MANSQLEQYYANHRWFVIGGLAAAVAAVIGVVQLRKSPTAITITAPVAASGAAAGYAPSDVLAAYGAGSAATAAGAAPLVGLGQGGLDLAATALQSESDTLQALGNTQASMGGSLTDLLKSFIGSQQGTPNPPSGYQQPVSAPTQPIGTIDPSSSTRLLSFSDRYVEVVPTQSTYTLGPVSSVYDPALQTMGPAYPVTQNGQSLAVLARNLVSIS